jgi:hypothetical protein
MAGAARWRGTARCITPSCWWPRGARVEGRDQEVNTRLTLATRWRRIGCANCFPLDIHGSATGVFRCLGPPRLCGGTGALPRSDTGGCARGTTALDAAAPWLAEEVLAGRLPLKSWITAWTMDRAAQFGCPVLSHLALAAVTEEARRHTVEQLCHGAFNYKGIKDRDARPLVRGGCPLPTGVARQHAPERLALANGRRPKSCRPTPRAHRPGNPESLA